ncbi:MAG: hypothetical protein RLY93_20405 [Sumerlaeia bacterium]
MRPLHARTRDDYIRLIEEKMVSPADGSASGEGPAGVEEEPQGGLELSRLLRSAIEDYRADEDFCAWVASVAYGMEIPEAPEILNVFLKEHPLSIRPVQVDWAELLLREGRIDHGANEARAYLHRLNEFGLAEHMELGALIADGVLRAFLMLSALYTETGARSYSLRLLDFAFSMPRDAMDPPRAAEWQARLEGELGTLRRELADERLRAVDRVWEEFFRGGVGTAELVWHCGQMYCPILAKRVEVLAEQFRDEPDFTVGDEEIFQMVYQSEAGAFLLV